MRTSEAAKLPLDAPPGCEELCRTHYARVFQLCRLLLVDRHEAEDVAQEVFLKLVKECQTQSQVLSWEAWLTRVTVNACRDRRRSAWWKWWREEHAEFQEAEYPSSFLTPEEQILSREQQERIWHLFRALSPRQREVFVLRRLEGLSGEDVAEVLGLTTGSVKRHLFHAIHHLRKALGDR
ncbi:MAG: sigma-70 family RNA polymerase sigma factor [Deltaproteobacteria bacterium]|nr:sigma-70 family RNA polymerase sigma factor [Deltaproteobacteria bacterium]